MNMATFLHFTRIVRTNVLIERGNEMKVIASKRTIQEVFSDFKEKFTGKKNVFKAGMTEQCKRRT